MQHSTSRYSAPIYSTSQDENMISVSFENIN